MSTTAGQPASESTAFDVFLSHNSREKPMVERLARRLRDAGLEPWFDAWCVTPGGRWQEELANGIRASRACAVFIGPNDAGNWEREELELALDRAAKHRAFRVFLVLLPGVAERFDINTLSPFLSTRTWVDLRAGFDSARSFQPLVNAIKGVPLDPPPRAVDAASATCPYRGLEAFDSDHAEFYFGRDREVQRLVEQLKSTRFLAVLGPSGSGKSSLALAGLVPALRRGALPGSHDWPIQILTPGADPLAQLAAHFTRFSGSGTMQGTLDQLSADPRTLHLATTLAMADRPPDVRSVWIVDQFEEIFTLCRDEQARTQFVANLLHASAPEGRSVVIITLRADFYHRCVVYAGLSQRVSGNQLLVGPMDTDGLRQAIEEPARLVGLEFEEGLVDTIIEDVEGEPGALPLLEHSLFELWSRRRGQMLTLEAYRESGGVQGALARRADTIYAALDDSGQATARRLLLRLTQFGDGSGDTRRRASLTELVTRTDTAASVDAVVHAWTGARLLTSAADESGERWISVSHEALIRSWPRFRKWIDEDRAGQRLNRLIAEAAAEWRRMNRDPSLLWRGLRLGQAREFQSEHDDVLNELESGFIDAGIAQEAAEVAQRDRRRRQVLAGLTAGIVVALGLSGLAGWQWLRAEREQLSATARGIVAEANLLRSQALTGAPGWATRLERGALLAIEGHRLRATPESAQIVRAAADDLGRSTQAFAAPDLAEDSLPAFSPERDELALVAKDERTVRLLNLGTGQTLHAFAAGGSVRVLEYSARGSYLAVTMESAAEMWDLRERTAPRRLWSTSLGPFEGIAQAYPGVFSPDEALFAGIAGNAVVVLETPNGAVKHRIDYGDAVTQVAFSADGSRLISASKDKTAVVLTLATGATTRLQLGQEGNGVAIDARGRMVAVVHAASVYFLDVASKESLGHVVAFPGREDVQYVTTVVFDETGSRLGVKGDHGTGVQVDVASLSKTWEDPNYGDNWQLFTWNPRFMGVKRGGGIEVWDVALARPLRLVLHQGDVSKLELMFFSPETGRLVLLEDAQIWSYDTRAGSIVRQRAFDPKRAPIPRPDRRTLAFFDRGAVTLLGVDDESKDIRVAPPEAVSAASWSRDGQRLLTRNDKGAARVWDARDGREVWSGSGLNAAALAPDGGLVVAALPDNSVRAWETASGRQLWTQSGVPAKVTVLDDDDDEIVVANVQRVVFSANGDRVALELRKGPPRGWSTRNGQELPPDDARTLAARGQEGSRDEARSADGSYRAVLHDTSEDRSVRIVETSSGRELAALRHDGDPDPDRNRIFDVAFSPDGRHVVTGGADRTARIWTRDGREAGRITQVQLIDFVAFTSDGRHVTTVDGDGVLRTWLWRHEDLVAHVCSRIARNLSREEWSAHLGTAAYEPTCTPE